MFCKVIYTAKIGTDRRTVETYMNAGSDGEMRLTFDSDIDWSAPIHMMIEPAVELNCHVSRVTRSRCAPNVTGGIVKEALENRPIREFIKPSTHNS